MKRTAIIAFICLMFCAVGVTAKTPSHAEKAEAELYWQNFKRDDNTGFISEFAALQYLLLAHGMKVKVDGVFGAQTESALKKFQRAHSLKADGIFDTQTLKRLVVTVKRGSRGDAVRALQTLLRGADPFFRKNALNKKTRVDGVFGEQTLKALHVFQLRYKGEAGELAAGKIQKSGTVRLKTWIALFNTKDFYGAG